MIYIRGNSPIYISQTPCVDEEDCAPLENPVHISNLEGQNNHAVVLSCSADAIHLPTAECDECQEFIDELALKQDKLTAGDGISIDADNVISATAVNSIRVGGVDYDIDRQEVATISGVEGLLITYDDGSPDGGSVFLPDGVGMTTIAGQLTNLQTTNKSNLVAAINEVLGDIVTYSLSINNNVITLTGSDSSSSSVTLPVYNGGVNP